MIDRSEQSQRRSDHDQFQLANQKQHGPAKMDGQVHLARLDSATFQVPPIPTNLCGQPIELLAAVGQQQLIAGLQSSGESEEIRRRRLNLPEGYGPLTAGRDNFGGPAQNYGFAPRFEVQGERPDIAPHGAGDRRSQG